jgi:DNA-binding HxlR family transcriptional regulator
VASVIEDVVGCKWTLHILGRIRQGVVRPGALQRSVPGLTTKVLNQRLHKLVRYGLLEKEHYPERALHVEYHLTPFGQRINGILDQIDMLQCERDGRSPRHPDPSQRQTRTRAQRPSDAPIFDTTLQERSRRRSQSLSSGDLETHNAAHDEADGRQPKGRGWLAKKGNAQRRGSDRANTRPDGVGDTKRK